MVLRYSPRFYPFSGPSPGTHPGPSPILDQIPHFWHSPGIPTFRHLPGFYPFWYSLEFQISNTRPDSTLSNTRPDFTFPALAQILPFPILTWIPHFRHSHILPFLDTHPYPSLILTRILPFRHFPGFYPFWYSPRFHLSSTRSDFTLFGTCPDSTFSTLARILPFPGTHPDLSPVLARIPHFWHSPGFHPFSILTQTLLRYSRGFHLFGTRPNFYFFGTCPDSALFLYSLGFYFLGTRPNSTFSGTRPDPPFSGTRPDPFLVLARIHPSPVLAWIPHFPILIRTLLRYSPKFHISDTHRILPFLVLTRIQPFPMLAQTLLWSLPGFPHLLRHRPRISLYFLTLCPDHSSSQASYLVFFMSFNWSDSILLDFNTR